MYNYCTASYCSDFAKDGLWKIPSLDVHVIPSHDVHWYSVGILLVYSWYRSVYHAWMGCIMILTAAGLLWTTNFLAWGDNCRELAAVVRTTTNGLQLRFIPSRRCRMCGLSNDWVKIGCLLDPWVFVPLSAPIICFYQRVVNVHSRVCGETKMECLWESLRGDGEAFLMVGSGERVGAWGQAAGRAVYCVNKVRARVVYIWVHIYSVCH